MDSKTEAHTPSNKRVRQHKIVEGRQDAVEDSETTEILGPKRPILVLINPHSGRGKSVELYRKRLVPFLESHNVNHHVFITKYDSRVHDYLYKKSFLELMNLKSIIVVSGDGLFHEVVNALMSREDWERAISIPIGIIPTGSGNGLAYSLLRQKHPDLSGNDEAIKICCEQAIQDETCFSDLIKVTYGCNSTVWSFLSFGWGLLADIDIDSEWLRRLGELRFTVYGLLRSITSTSYRGRLSYKIADGEKERLKVCLAEESNTAFKMNNETPDPTKDEEDQKENFDEWIHIEDKFACLYAVYQSYVSSVTNFSPKSTPTDQLIYLTYIRGKLNACKVVEFLLAIKDGSHENLPYVKVVPVSKFKFQPLEPSKVVVDGEVIPWNFDDGPITARILPKMIKLSWKP